jgi:Protein of unknown function (DUF1475)
MVAIVKKINALIVPNLIGYCGFFIMCSFIFYAMVYGDFFKEGAILTSLPWGVVSLVDIYLGLILFSSWVVWREDDKRIAFIWTILIITLGNVLSCLYVIKAAYEADGNILSFWLGKKAEDKHVI